MTSTQNRRQTQTEKGNTSSAEKPKKKRGGYNLPKYARSQVSTNVMTRFGLLALIAAFLCSSTVAFAPHKPSFVTSRAAIKLEAAPTMVVF